MFLILENRLIGPFTFDYNLNGRRYLDLLRAEILPALREIVPNEADFRKLWLQQDGCPAYNTAPVIEFLRENFGNNVIALNGSIPWPARSPDLSPLDFYLWGHAKIYEFEPSPNVDVLRERVINTFAMINRNSLGRVISRVLKNCEKCRRANGRHFENLPD